MKMKRFKKFNWTLFLLIVLNFLVLVGFSLGVQKFLPYAKELYEAVIEFLRK